MAHSGRCVPAPLLWVGGCEQSFRLLVQLRVPRLSFFHCRSLALALAHEPPLLHGGRWLGSARPACCQLAACPHGCARSGGRVAGSCNVNACARAPCRRERNECGGWCVVGWRATLHTLRATRNPTRVVLRAAAAVPGCYQPPAVPAPCAAVLPLGAVTYNRARERRRPPRTHARAYSMVRD